MATSNSEHPIETLAFIKLEGSGLEEGLISAKSGAEILTSIDRLVRRGVTKKYPELSDIQFDVPVLVKKGSWTALIPTDVAHWVITAVGASVTAYGVKAAQSMADSDFNEVGIKDAVKKSFSTLQGVSRLTKHLKGSGKKPEGIRFIKDNKFLLVPDENGEFLEVSKEDYDAYHSPAAQILSDVAKSSTGNQSIKIGLSDENDNATTEVIKPEEKHFFIKEDALEASSKILFPELKHGDRVELVGLVTRANSKPNTMGFEYKGHILPCDPLRGKVEQFKPQLFKKCVLTGRVKRLMADGIKETLLKPRLVIEALEIIDESQNVSMELGE